MVADISSAVLGANSLETYYAVFGGDSDIFYFDYSKSRNRNKKTKISVMYLIKRGYERQFVGI